MDSLPSLDGTRLDADAYLARLDSDVEAMLAASEDLGLEVPSCPGWTVSDLLSHVIGVYRHKNAVFETGASPGDAPADGWGALAAGEDPRVVLRAEYSVLRGHLATRDPAEVVWTWWPSEQTVGFWQRRMALETAVHRWDAETAAYGVDDANAVDDALASDGVDELLGWLRWPWGDELAQPEAHGQRVLVSTVGHSWTVTLHPTEVGVVGGGDDAEALVAGDPSGLLLHLWGRAGEHGIASGGDVESVRLLRERLAMVAS
jgi:uncharacterized protein (TIGR03083 family)